MVRLKDIGEETPATPTPDKKVVDVTKTQDNLNKTYNLNLVNDAAAAAKGSVSGLLYGGIGGVVIAYFFKKPLYWGAIGGAAVGGVLGYASNQASCD